MHPPSATTRGCGEIKIYVNYPEIGNTKHSLQLKDNLQPKVESGSVYHVADEALMLIVSVLPAAISTVLSVSAAEFLTLIDVLLDSKFAVRPL